MNEKATKLIVLLAVAASSPASIFSRMIAGPSMVTAMYRMAMTTLLLLPVVLWKHRQEIKVMKTKNILLCMLSGACLGMHFTTYFEGFKYTTIAAGAVLADTEVLFVAVALLILFREKIPKTGMIGIGLTFAGSVIIALGDQSGGRNILYGDGMALLAAMFSAGYTLIGRDQRKKLSTTLYTFLVYASACLTLLLLIIVTGQTMEGYSASDFGYVFGIVLCCTLLGHNVFSWALKYVSAAYVSTAKLAEPVFAAGMAVVLFREVPMSNQVIGGMVIIAGIGLYLLAKDRREEDGAEQGLGKKGNTRESAKKRG